MNKKSILPLFLISVFVACAPSAWWWLNWRFAHFTNPWLYAHITELQVVSCSLLVLSIYNHLRKNKTWSQVLVLIAGVAGFYCLLLSFYYHTHLNTNDTLPISNADICMCAGIVGLLAWWMIRLSSVTELGTQLYSAPNDQLGRMYSYNGLVRYVREHMGDNLLLENKCGSTMAILGSWGSGKSHCLEHIKYKLSRPLEARHDCGKQKTGKMYENAFLICEVSLWKCKSVDDAWLNIVNALNQKISGKNAFVISALSGRLFAVFIELAASVSIPGASTLAAIMDVIFSSAGSNVEHSAEVIDAELGCRRAILILDDVERADYEIISRLFPLINQLRKISKLTVICAISEDELEQVCCELHGMSKKSLHGYLTKVFDYMISLPPITQLMLNLKMKEDIEDMKTSCPLVCSFIKNFHIWFDTPRQMETVLRLWVMMERQYFSSREGTAIDIGELSKTFLNRAYLSFFTIALKHCEPGLLEKLHDGEDYRYLFNEVLESNADYYNFYNKILRFKLKGENKEYEGYLARTVLTNLYTLLNETDANDHKYALQMEFAKAIHLSDMHCEEIIVKSHDNKQIHLEELIGEFLGEEKLEIGRMRVARFSLLYYAVKKSHKDKIYIDFASKALEGSTAEELANLPEEKSWESPVTTLLTSIINAYLHSACDVRVLLSSIWQNLLAKVEIDTIGCGLHIAFFSFKKQLYKDSKASSVPNVEVMKNICLNNDYKRIMDICFSSYSEKLVDYYIACEYDENKTIDIESVLMLEMFSDYELHGKLMTAHIEKRLQGAESKKDIIGGALKLLNVGFISVQMESRDVRIISKFQPRLYEPLFNEVKRTCNENIEDLKYYRARLLMAEKVVEGYTNLTFNDKYEHMKGQPNMLNSIRETLSYLEKSLGGNN